MIQRKYIIRSTALPRAVERSFLLGGLHAAPLDLLLMCGGRDAISQQWVLRIDLFRGNLFSPLI